MRLSFKDGNWIRWLAMVCLVIPAIVLIVVTYGLLLHPQLWFGLRRFLGFGLAPVVLTGVAWKWPRIGSPLAIAYGAFFLLFNMELATIAIVMYGIFSLGGVLNIAACLMERRGNK